MKIAIIGFGKMGHEISSVAKDRNINFITIDPFSPNANFKKIDKTSLASVDVVIDFTNPESALKNLEIYIKHNVNVVMGTTGWYKNLKQVESKINKSNIGFIWSGNFSIGVNLFFQIIERAAELINNVKNYDVFLHEFHHKNKIDSPSGTAEMLGKILINKIDKKKKIVTDKLSRQIQSDEIHISSTRAGFITGTHLVGFDSEADAIELKHIAKNRTGFALGAVLAAEFIYNKKGFYNFNDFLNSFTGNKNV